LNLGQVFGWPLGGYLSDSFGRINLAFLATLLTSFFCFVIWIFATNFGTLAFFSLVVDTVVDRYILEYSSPSFSRSDWLAAVALGSLNRLDPLSYPLVHSRSLLPWRYDRPLEPAISTYIPRFSQLTCFLLQLFVYGAYAYQRSRVVIAKKSFNISVTMNII